MVALLGLDICGSVINDDLRALNCRSSMCTLKLIDNLNCIQLVVVN